MSGRPKMKMYEYDRSGKLVQIYQTQSELFDKFYEGKKRPLVREGKIYAPLPNGNYVCERMVGRDVLRNLLRTESSKYTARAHEKRIPISAYNLAGEKIATFRSVHMASVLTGISRASIDNSAKANPTKRKKYTKTLELIFRYDENSVSL